MTAPVFAIVGHPNKGKSSLVSTLSEDTSVAISPIPGTTVDNRCYPLVVDGETLYELIDTPGFQRARAAWEWIQHHANSAMDRADTVRRFVETHRDDTRYTAECNLLTPILAGAGILYVVDGSRPFGEDYQAEMEILRWTGQPSLALINMIGDNDYTEQWHRALGQYFRIVRVFNAVLADFDHRVQLLTAFGEIREQWRPALDNAVRILRDEQAQRRTLAARLIAEMLARMMTHVRRRKPSPTAPIEDLRTTLLAAYKNDLAVMEQRCREQVQQLYQHRSLERHGESHESLLQLLGDDLFSNQTWVLFGLTRQQLVATGALGGAAAGGIIDIATHGTSLLLGSGIGALAGSVSAWLSSDRIANFKVMGLPLGGEEVSIGPMKNINFPYVALSRALLHQGLIERRTHAQRGPLMIGTQPAPQLAEISVRKPFEKLFKKLRKQETGQGALIASLAARIKERIEHQSTGLVNKKSPND